MQRRMRVPWADAVIAMVLAIGALVSTVMDAAAAHPLADIIAVLVAGSVALRTVAPWAMAIVASLGVVAISLLPDPSTPLWAFVTSLVVAFSLASRLTGWQMFAALGMLLVAEYVIQVRTSTSTVEMLLTPPVLVAAPAVAGWLLARSRAQAQRLRTLSAELAASRSHVAALSADAERMRITRDLHDALGHTLSSIAVQAGAAGSLLEEEHPARAPVERIRLAAHDGLDDVRHVLSAQRPADDGLTRVAELALHSGAELTVTGARQVVAGDPGDACFRIVQEALTNARRHAPGAPVRVLVDHRPGELVLEIVNGGPIGTVRPDGRGLIGMRQRALACGGRVEASPAGDGWCVRVWMPLPEAAT
ncbi:histidine kinase [Microbacterium horticulturae]|uniref:histidine kinase n=1 Tax=Microbacterium horticulturae TaxID=3028316 RepID=A0ABY8BWI0_9MICO|nr:histidine kinase [Microbacterium sp. KACC 23027]WEG08524.1 histidine kinase [Microbacterium sp. KACC 23027]